MGTLLGGREQLGQAARLGIATVLVLSVALACGTRESAQVPTPIPTQKPPTATPTADPVEAEIDDAVQQIRDCRLATLELLSWSHSIQTEMPAQVSPDIVCQDYPSGGYGLWNIESIWPTQYKDLDIQVAVFCEMVKRGAIESPQIGAMAFAIVVDRDLQPLWAIVENDEDFDIVNQLRQRAADRQRAQ